MATQTTSRECFQTPVLTPEQEQDAKVLPEVDAYLARGLDLKRWWNELERAGGPKEQFPLDRPFNRPTRSFGFYGNAPVGGAIMPVMGNVQEMFYDQTRVPAAQQKASAEWLRDQLREFVMKYFMRISSFRQAEAFVDVSHPVPPPALASLSWCPAPSVQRVGFGFSQLFNKPAESSEYQPFPTYARHAIVDQREVGPKYDSLVLKVRIFDFAFHIRPLGERGPELVFSENEESYLAVSKEFVDYRDVPFQTVEGRTVLGEYGIGYAFVKSPTPGPFAYGPGEFDAAIELIKFRIYESGYISVRMIFVANRVQRVLNVTIDPVNWTFDLANLFSLGLTKKIFTPVRDVLNRLPLRFVIDPVSAYVSAANGFSAGYAAETLCISTETLERVFLVKHFEQHYEAVVGSLLTWRLIPDWLDSENLPPWVVAGLSS